jgi:hypothetical protein
MLELFLIKDAVRIFYHGFKKAPMYVVGLLVMGVWSSINLYQKNKRNL